MAKNLYLVALPLLVACSPETPGGGDVATYDDAPADEDELQPACNLGSDLDDDGISSADEGAQDFDNDRIPNYRDPDSDGDEIGDDIEGGDDDCTTPPLDSDGDEMPDFLDNDSDGNGISDLIEGGDDSDGDGRPDSADTDNDGDNLSDMREIGDDPVHPKDIDEDAIPDYLDPDSDNDGIPDAIEGEVDRDGDGLPACTDDDSDGDGYMDSEELNFCNRDFYSTVDTDGDHLPDFLDIDSDGDGLSDSQEHQEGTSRCVADTDEDGFDDLFEWAHPVANPLDPRSTITEEEYYFRMLKLPPGGPLEERDLEFGTDIQMADIFFIIDTTASMYEEINEIKTTLSSTIIPNIRARIRNAWFGIGWHADFPTDPYGSEDDKPFELVQRMTENVTDLQNAVNSIPNKRGGDWAESQVEALYQTATGKGLGSWVEVYSCADPAEVGAPCFRPGSLPIILLLTDAPMHNGPPGTVGEPYSGIDPAPHTWSEAMAALNEIHARVIGLDSEEEGTSAFHDLRETAIATGAVDLDGNHLVFNVEPDGELLDTTVVNSIEAVTTRVPFDVDTYTVDEPDSYAEPEWQEIDARCFIKRRIPQPRWTPPPGFTYREAVASYDQSVFYLVLPGTRLIFKVQFQNYIMENSYCYQGDKIARVFLAKIIVRGAGVTNLDEKQIVIIVPAREVPVS